MKSFFKKLAFVMALAMVVTMAAPAAQASAADALGIALQDAKSDAEVIETYNVGVQELVDFKYYGAPKNYLDLKPTWDSLNPEVASVSQKGEVTGLKDGVATITITLSDGKTGSIEITVGKGNVDLTAFEAEMSSDSTATLKFNDTTITAADLQENLTFSYYVTADFDIELPLIKKVTDKGNGVFLVEMYDGFTFADGTVYEFGYKDFTPADFTCVIGTVAHVELGIKDVTGYVVDVNDEGYEFTSKLYNENGKDITTTALAKGVYVEYEVSEDEDGKYYPTGDAGIMFDEPATAVVKVSCFELNEDGEPVKLVDELSYPVTAKNPDPYDITFNQAPAFTIVKDVDGVDWTKGTNSKLAVGDDGYSLLVKLGDNKKNEVGTNEWYYKNGKKTTAWDEGEFRFESTNVSRLYITDDGALMPNAKGNVNVLVYFTPDQIDEEVPVEKLVAAISLYVNAPRTVGSISVDVSNKTLSTKNVNKSNETTITVNVLDTLNEKVGVEDVEVKLECTTADTALKNGATNPYKTAKTANVVDGKVTFKLTANDAVVAAGKSQVYNFKVTAGGKSETFSITVKAPSNTTEFTKYALIFGNTKIEDATTVDNIKLSVGVAGINNGVASTQLPIAGPKLALDKCEVGKLYYVVSKDGTDITEKTTLAASGGTLYINVTGTKSVDYAPTTGTTDDALTVVDLTHGAGKYSVTIYEVAKNTKGDTYFKQLKGAKDTYTVENKLPVANAKVKKLDPEFNGTDVTAAVMKCFEFKVGDKTFAKAADYDGYKIAINQNVVAGGDVCFVNSVTFYMLSKSGAYVDCGTVTVNDYITFVAE